MGYSPWGRKESDTTEPLKTLQSCILPTSALRPAQRYSVTESLYCTPETNANGESMIHPYKKNLKIKKTESPT